MQWSTANVGPSRKQNFALPRERVRWLSPAAEMPAAHSEFQALALPSGARALSRYTAAGVPRDIALPAGKGQALLVNGLLSDTDSPAYWDRLLGGWAGLRASTRVSGPDIIGSRLSAGDTEILFAYNYGGSAAPVSAGSMGTCGCGHKAMQSGQLAVSNAKRRAANSRFALLTANCPLCIRPALPLSHSPTLPVASVRALARDGRQWQEIPFTTQGGQVRFHDRVRYYAVYEVARSAVRVDWPDPVFQPGEARAVPVRLRNLTDRPVKGRLSLQGYVPTLKAEPVAFALPPRGQATAQMRIRSDARAEWGRRTVVLRVDANGRRCSLWRPLTLERNPDLQLTASFPEPGKAVLTVRNQASPYIGTAPAAGIRLRLGDRDVGFGALKAGQSRSATVEGLAPEAGDAPFAELPARLSYASRSLRKEVATSLRVPVVQESAPRLAGAEGLYQVYNPADRPVEGEIVNLGMASAEPAHVREAGGHAVPSQVSNGKLYALVSLPPRSALTLYRCPGAAPTSLSDLRVETRGLGTGTGEVALRNSRLSLTIGEANGGAVTSLVSAVTGSDYGRSTFGATEGVFGKPNPANPVIGSTDYIKEKRRRMEAPAEITLEAEGPLFAAVRVSAKLGGRQVSTRYRLAAHSAQFQVERTLTPAAPKPGEELVVLDVPLQRNALAKIFPNFTGVVAAENHPHFGWREAGYVPPYASIMDGTGFRESISFVVRSKEGIGRFRQGIWPAERPKPGPAAVAWLEYLAAPGAPRASLALTVAIHEGTQRVARRLLEEPAPYVIAVPQPRWEGERSAADAPADWLLPYHHGRAPLTISGPVQAGQWLAVPLQDGMPAQGDYRLVVTEGEGARVLPVRLLPGLGVAGWLASGSETEGRAFLYYDERAGGPDLALAKAADPPGKDLRDASFEDGAGAWLLEGAERVQAPGAAGAWAMRLHCRDQGVPCLASNASMALQPNSTYRLTFRAKSEEGVAMVRTNLYAGGAYDFPQKGIEVQPDEWRAYMAELVTGPFPVGVQLALRLWSLDPGQRALVDDIRLERLGERPETTQGVRVELGPAERSGGS